MTLGRFKTALPHFESALNSTLFLSLLILKKKETGENMTGKDLEERNLETEQKDGSWSPGGTSQLRTERSYLGSWYLAPYQTFSKLYISV